MSQTWATRTLALLVFLWAVPAVAQPVNPPQIYICEHESYEDTAYYLALPEDSAERHFLRGIAYHHRAQYSRAIKEYKKALVLEPDDARIHYHLGSAYFSPSLHKKAVQHWRRCLKLKPGMYMTHGYLGLSLGYLGRAQESADELRMGRSVVPQTLKQCLYQASMLFFTAEYSKAIAYSNKTIAQYPKKGPYMVRGRCFLHLKRYERAILDFTHIIEHYPFMAWAYEYRARAYEASGHSDLALADRASFKRLKRVVLK